MAIKFSILGLTGSKKKRIVLGLRVAPKSITSWAQPPLRCGLLSRTKSVCKWQSVLDRTYSAVTYYLHNYTYSYAVQATENQEAADR